VPVEGSRQYFAVVVVVVAVAVVVVDAAAVVALLAGLEGTTNWNRLLPELCCGCEWWQVYIILNVFDDGERPGATVKSEWCVWGFG